MEWFTIVAISLLIILAFILGVLLIQLFSGQRCILSIEKRKPNPELTRAKLEEESANQSPLFLSDQTFQPITPVEDVKKIQVSIKLGDGKSQSLETITNNQSRAILVPIGYSTPAERKARQKEREQIRKKYRL